MTFRKGISMANEKAAQQTQTLWWVIMEVEPGSGKTLAPYMDVPRIFQCEKYEAVDLFKKFYGIRATENTLTVRAATDEEFAAQKKRDKMQADGIRFSRDQIIATMKPAA
jgi:hypothetical protein